MKIEVPITLPRPRDPLSVEFLDYQKQLLRHLGQEAHAWESRLTRRMVERCDRDVLALGGAPAGAARRTTIRRGPIRLVVGFGAGGPTDIPARYVADKLGTALGQRMIVENKPAAAGMLATRDVLAQPADGYNLLFCTHFESINTAVYKNPGFKLADLAPISLVAKYYYGIALSNSIPAETFEQFVQYAKAHPGEVTYATIGAGSAQEIMARQLEKIAGISMNRIPFRGGPQVVQEMVAGRVNFYASPTIAVVPQYQQKQLKLLATTSPTRIPSLPEVPTLEGEGHRLRAVRLARLLRRRRARRSRSSTGSTSEIGRSWRRRNTAT